MDRDEALKLLKGGEEGIREWNDRRRAHEAIPNLIRADLTGANLIQSDLTGATLIQSNLSGADLSGANLGDANLFPSNLSGANLSGANLSGANFGGTLLGGAKFSGVGLRGAKLSGVDLTGAKLIDVDLTGADLGDALCGATIFADVDLSEVRGLDSIRHRGPSTIGIDTLFLSKGKIPEGFLRGCGVPDALIVQQRALVGAMEPIQFYSCFISYSTKNQDFAERLHSKMRDMGLRVWFAPEDVQGGKKLHEQIDEAIRVYDKLLLVLSPESMNSEWVRTEIRKARKAEIKEGKRKLFPIRLVDFNKIREWECFDADSGKDLGVEIREFFIPDFSNWKGHDSFEAAFARLLKDLKAEESIGSKHD